MYQRILVAVDGSTTSMRALREALRLAEPLGSKLRIVHVIDLVNVNMETVRGQDEFEDAVRESGERLLPAVRIAIIGKLATLAG